VVYYILYLSIYSYTISCYYYISYLYLLPDPRCRGTVYCGIAYVYPLYLGYYILYLYSSYNPIYRTTVYCTALPAPPLHLVPPISRGYDVVWYYISYPIITVVLRVSCTTVTTRFSPTRRHFSRVLQYIGKSVPPNTESFHLANSTIYSTYNNYPTTISCGFSARVWPLCNMYKNRVKIPSVFV